MSGKDLKVKCVHHSKTEGKPAMVQFQVLDADDKLGQTVVNYSTNNHDEINAFQYGKKYTITIAEQTK